jgi:hypothetical protein
MWFRFLGHSSQKRRCLNYKKKKKKKAEGGERERSVPLSTSGLRRSVLESGNSRKQDEKKTLQGATAGSRPPEGPPPRAAAGERPFFFKHQKKRVLTGFGDVYLERGWHELCAQLEEYSSRQKQREVFEMVDKAPPPLACENAESTNRGRRIRNLKIVRLNARLPLGMRVGGKSREWRTESLFGGKIHSRELTNDTSKKNHFGGFMEVT